MTDFHSHLLPGLDDGSDSLETSLAMLGMWQEQRVTRIAATPHFYADVMSPRRFLTARNEALDRLREEMERACLQIEVVPGAEVRFFSGISAADALDDLCLSGTRLLLLEMPFHTVWTERMLREVAAISRRGIVPVAAHIERYIRLQPKRLVRDFWSLDIRIQSNASFFLDRHTARTALRLLRDDRIHFLGTDAHNTTSRPPNLGKALELIGQKLGPGTLQRLEEYDRLTWPEDGKS